jgi:hypothetical protein
VQQPLRYCVVSQARPEEIIAVSTNEKPPVDKDNQKQPAPKNQGEGDYESARKYDEDTRNFIKTADVSDLARRAAPGSKEEAAKLKEAEEIGRSHAIGGRGAESWPKEKNEAKPTGKPDSGKTAK